MHRIDEDLKTVINEEQGVSMELYNKTYEIYNIITSSVTNNKNCNECGIKGVKYKNGSLDYKDFFGNSIIIEYYFYNFINNNVFKNEANKIKRICRIKNKSILQITIFAVSGTILSKITLDDLSHELEHLYQYNKADKIFASSSLYNKAIMVKKKCDRDRYEYCVADAIYISRKFEQDAYFQSLYINLMQCNLLEEFDEVLTHSDIYNALRALKIHLNDIKYFGYIPTIFQNENYSYQKLITDCKNAIKNIQWKMARVYNKAFNDYREKHITDEKFNYKNNDMNYYGKSY